MTKQFDWTAQSIRSAAMMSGWRVSNTKDGGFFLYPSNGSPPIKIARNYNPSDDGHDAVNVRARLRRAGLVLPNEDQKGEATPAVDVEPPAAPVAPNVSEVGSAVLALEEMVMEMAEQFATFRKYTQDELIAIRGRVEAIHANDSAAGKLASDIDQIRSQIRTIEARTGLAITRAKEAMEARMQEAESRINPLATLRAKLG